VNNVAVTAILTFAAMLSTAPDLPDFEWHGSVARGNAIEIQGVTGDIHAVPSEKQEVEILARFAQEGGGQPVDIRVNQSSNGLTVCAVRTPTGACATKDDPMGVPGARVDYFVRVPSGVHFTGRTVNGEILVDSLRSNVQAHTVNGKVTISTTGTAQASTVNGSIQADLLKPFWSRPPEFSTVNGGITLKIPTGTAGAVKAETKNGKVVAEVPFCGDATDQTLEGSIGNGGAGLGNPLLLRAINGTIEIRQRY
jgi:hypothetical protein